MKYGEKFEILVHDVDTIKRGTLSKTIKYMQETANHQLRDEKPSYEQLFLDNKAFILSRMIVEFSSPLYQYDKIDSYTWTCDGHGAAHNRCYEIIRDNQSIVKGFGVWALVDTKTKKLYRHDEISFPNYSKDQPLSLNVPVRLRIPNDISLNYAGHHIVNFSDIDCNRHMNNTNYPDILCNVVEDIEQKEVRAMNINFISEAPYKSDIKIYMCSTPVITENGESEYYFRTTVEDKTNIEAMIRFK